MTAWGKQQYEATRGEFSRAGEPAVRQDGSLDPAGNLPLFNPKDGMLRCDPLGYPRVFTYNYGFEFDMSPERVLQFFEWGHTWRTIWTDGRKLPDNPPEYRWLGWSIGYWEGDTFVVESNGFDDRSWLAEVWNPGRYGKLVGYGWPHSDEMKIVERYRGSDYGTLEVTMTVIDPKTYTMPWETKATINLNPDTELWAYFCVPSDAEEFNRSVAIPAAGATGRID